MNRERERAYTPAEDELILQYREGKDSYEALAQKLAALGFPPRNRGAIASRRGRLVRDQRKPPAPKRVRSVPPGPVADARGYLWPALTGWPGEARRSDKRPMGEEHHKAKVTSNVVERARQLRATGMSYAAIGKEVGAHWRTVCDWCKGATRT